MALYSGMIPLTEEKTVFPLKCSNGKSANKLVKKADGVTMMMMSESLIQPTRSVLTLILSMFSSTERRYFRFFLYFLMFSTASSSRIYQLMVDTFSDRKSTRLNSSHVRISY